MRPIFRRTDPEIIVRCSLVPEHLILQLVRLRVVIDHEALKVLRTLVHHLTEGIEIRKHTGILVIQFPPIVDDVLAENKHVVDVRAEIRRNTHRVLHRDNEHCVDVAPIHKQITHIPVTDPRLIVQTVVQNQEIPWVDGGGAPLRKILGDLFGDEFLAFEHIGDDQRIILLVDEHLRHELSVELIRSLRAGNNSPTREALIVPEEVLHQEGLAGFAFSDENHDFIVLDLGHIEFLETQIQASTTSTSTGTSS